MENTFLNNSIDMLKDTCADFCNQQVRVGYEEGIKIASQHIEMFIVVAFIGVILYLISGLLLRANKENKIFIGLNNISRMVVMGMIWLLFLKVILGVF